MKSPVYIRQEGMSDIPLRETGLRAAVGGRFLSYTSMLDYNVEVNLVNLMRTVFAWCIESNEQ